MYLNVGEVREVGIEVVSQINQDFTIDSADYRILTLQNIEIERGTATINGHNILTLFSAQNTGTYIVEFTYRIGPEILKAKINIIVN